MDENRDRSLYPDLYGLFRALLGRNNRDRQPGAPAEPTTLQSLKLEFTRTTEDECVGSLGGDLIYKFLEANHAQLHTFELTNVCLTSVVDLAYGLGAPGRVVASNGGGLQRLKLSSCELDNDKLSQLLRIDFATHMPLLTEINLSKNKFEGRTISADYLLDYMPGHEVEF